MSDTLVLPTATPAAWPRRLRRFVLTAALATGLGAVSWSLVELADHGSLVAEVAGYRISATIDEQMMLILAISHGESAPRAIRANDLFSSRAENNTEADYVYYDDEDQADEMVDPARDYQVAGQRHAAPKS